MSWGVVHFLMRKQLSLLFVTVPRYVYMCTVATPYMWCLPFPGSGIIVSDIGLHVSVDIFSSLQLQLEAGKNYQLLDDITGKKKWKVLRNTAMTFLWTIHLLQVQTSQGGVHLVCSTLLHISPPSLSLAQQLDGYVVLLLSMRWYKTLTELRDYAAKYVLR